MTQQISDEMVQKVYEACAEYPGAYIESYVLEVIDRMRAGESGLKALERVLNDLKHVNEEIEEAVHEALARESTR